MFSVNVQYIINICGQMEKYIVQINRSIEELEHSRRVLQGMNGLGDVAGSLNVKIRELYDEMNHVKKLVQTLNKVILLYQECESRICDNADSISWEIVLPETGVNDISEIKEILNRVLP